MNGAKREPGDRPPKTLRSRVPAARVVGITLLLGGLAAAWLALAWWRLGRADGSLAPGPGAFALGLLLALILPFMASGIYLMRHGMGPLDAAAADREWASLAVYMDDSGRLRLRDAVIGLGRPQREVCAMLAAAATAGRISGWLDLRQGTFQTDVSPGDRCPRCATAWSLAGEAVPVSPAASTVCGSCGLTYFGPPGQK